MTYLARVLDQPLTFFSPHDSTPQTDAEAELLGLFHKVSRGWQERILDKRRTQVELYERLLPYVQAGIPEEFYAFLIYETEETMELEDAASEGVPSDEEIRESPLRFERYREWEQTVRSQAAEDSRPVGLH